MSLSRRDLLLLSGASLLAPAFSLADEAREKRLVVVLLRGALDGLSAVPAIGDPDFVAARKGLAMQDGIQKLDGMFGLHPDLPGLGALYGQGELTIVHAVASPYRDRSHFDGQNMLETGATKPFGLDSGWLNRAIAKMSVAADRTYGMALEPHMPLLMRGSAAVSSWSPSVLPSPDDDTINRLAALYGKTDAKMAEAFAMARAANGTAGTDGPQRPFVGMMSAAAKFLSSPNGPRVAMAEMTGWDTHAAQHVNYGVLARNLRELDQGIAALKTGLGPAWKDTVVLLASEFGRTVAMNGTQGSDHGTGGALFLAGGAIRGGKVVADWPGLKTAALLDQRDLMPTTDLRSVIKGTLRDHMGLTAEIFPDSDKAKPLEGLIRT